MGKSFNRFEVEIAAPVEAVFEQLTDHEAMSDWPGISRVELVEEGRPRNGLGAVREINARGFKMQEKVVNWDPPHRLAYTICKGLPVDHLGVVVLTPQGDGTKLTWEITIENPWPLFARALGAALKRTLPGGIAHLKRTVEQRARQ